MVSGQLSLRCICLECIPQRKPSSLCGAGAGGWRTGGEGVVNDGAHMGTQLWAVLEHSYPNRVCFRGILIEGGVLAGQGSFCTADSELLRPDSV